MTNIYDWEKKENYLKLRNMKKKIENYRNLEPKIWIICISVK